MPTSRKTGPGGSVTLISYARGAPEHPKTPLEAIQASVLDPLGSDSRLSKNRFVKLVGIQSTAAVWAKPVWISLVLIHGNTNLTLITNWQ